MKWFIGFQIVLDVFMFGSVCIQNSNMNRLVRYTEEKRRRNGLS